MAIIALRYSESPELWERIQDLDADVWPQYNLKGDVMNVYWERLYEVFPDFQFVLYDEEADDVLAEGHTIPIVWDGTVDGLGPGIDATIAAGFSLRMTGGASNTLSALAAEIPPRHHDRGLSTAILRQMAEIARSAGFGTLVAPVRPSWKDRYPLTPIERYVRWSRADGQAFDPWVRVHVRLGATISKAIPESLRITGTVAEWESWTSMPFPETGMYVFPGGLAPLEIDRELDRGSYWEPNVWILHNVRS